MSIGDRLISIRKNEGMTQAIFATEFDISPRAYASYELGEREIPSSFLLKLYERFSISPSWLLTGEGAKSTAGHSENIVDAVVAVRTYAALKGNKIDPEREARLVLLLSEYFDEGGEKNTPLVKKMMEAMV